MTLPKLDAISVLGSGIAEVDFAGAAYPIIKLEGSGAITALGVVADSASLKVDGSGTIALDRVELERLTAQLDGSGDIIVNGYAATQDIAVRGSGSYDAAGLRSIDARVGVSGTGKAFVSAHGTLDAEVHGSGDIRYVGDPVVSRKVDGSGEISAG